MINFRVVNLDGMIAQLRAKGIEVTLDPEISHRRASPCQ
jgi:hypothetical protein